MELSDIKKQVTKVVELLVNGDYETLVNQDHGELKGEGGIHSAERLKEIIEEYATASGQELCIPPASAFDEIGILSYKPKEDWIEVRFALWYGEEESDLIMILDIISQKNWSSGIRGLNVW